MAEKQKKIVIETAHTKRSVVLPEGAHVSFVGNYVIAYPTSWRSSDVPIFQFRCEDVDPPMISIVEITEDEELVEKVKKLSKDEMNTLRNIMDSTGLL